MAIIMCAAFTVSASGADVSFDVIEKTIPELQQAMSEGRVTSRQLVEIYLARIAAYDKQGPHLNSMVALNPSALQDAEKMDRERAAKHVRGPLHGIPIVIKDNYETVGMPTAAGSLALAMYQSKTDAEQVRRLREAGAVIIGKTNMHELAAGITSISSVAGQTRNPYDLARYPGGSSGGTGTAVAANLAAAGMGSDTCGSIRIPAANNNLVGLRGTQGLSSCSGIVPLASTQDIGGPLARTLTDLAIMLDATVGGEPASEGHIPRTYMDALKPGGLKGARLGLLKLYFGADEEGSTVVRGALEQMKKLGAEVIELDVPGLEELLRDSSLIPHEMKFDLAAFLASRDVPAHTLDQILEEGLYDSTMEVTLTRRNAIESRDSEESRRARIKRDAIRNAVLTAMDEHRLSAVVYPTMRRKPARIGDPQTGSTCYLSSHSGLPALSVPAGFTDDGLPIGVEFLGRAWSESALLNLAYDWEQSSKLRRPPFSAPALVNGKAPGPVSFATKYATFTYDPVTAELKYDVRVDADPNDVLLVALHRGKKDAKGPIIARMIEHGGTRGAGVVTLGSREREALASGALYLRVYTRTQPLGGPLIRLAPPAAVRRAGD